MSQATQPNTGEHDVSISEELNSEVGTAEGNASIQEVLKAYTDLPPEKQRGRPVLSYQIPTEVAELILTSLPLTPLYKHSREAESTAAWRVADTSKALIRHTAPSRGGSPMYMLPPVGETQLDLRWLLLQSRSRDMPFTIEYLPDETTWSILKTTRPEHRKGVETLLNEAVAGSR